jgi:hypothetical protein
VIDQTENICTVDPRMKFVTNFFSYHLIEVKCPVAAGTYNLALTNPIPTNVDGHDVPSVSIFLCFPF